jgi:triosephosphate isomerase
MQQIVVAYEPVWAIGTGKVASVEMARQRHLFIQQVLTQKWGEACARQIPILYGGSVKPENAAQLLQEPTIDGFLVGGASLDPTSFQQILNKVRS